MAGETNFWGRSIIRIEKVISMEETIISFIVSMEETIISFIIRIEEMIISSVISIEEMIIRKNIIPDFFMAEILKAKKGEITPEYR